MPSAETRSRNGADDPIKNVAGGRKIHNGKALYVGHV